MTRPIAVLRPEPGNRATVDRVQAAGLPAITLPLFTVAPLDWSVSAGEFDGVLFTSANALRHGGQALATLTHLPVIAVGSATAAAAQALGFHVERVGTSNLATLLSEMPGRRRLLWLSGEDRTAIEHPSIASIVPIYRAAPLPIDPQALAPLAGSVAMIHSARAGVWLGELLDQAGIERAHVRLAAISAHAANRAGTGWGAIAVAERPDDPAMIATARQLAIDP